MIPTALSPAAHDELHREPSFELTPAALLYLAQASRPGVRRRRRMLRQEG